jgi:putative endonuclease
MFTVYALHNRERNKIYIGQTSDMSTRMDRHNQLLPTKNTSFTKRFSGKWILAYTEKLPTRAEALIREKQLKSRKGREYIWSIITSNLSQA